MSNKKSVKSMSRTETQVEQNRRDTITSSQPKRKRLIALIGIAVAIITAISISTFQIGSLERNAGVSEQAFASEKPDRVVHPVVLFNDGKAKHFEYRPDQGPVISYFIIKSSDGVIRAAFDACDVCWQAGRGYFQKGDYMVCRNCGRRFASILVNEVKGGCNPAPLERRVEGDDVVIEVRDILAGAGYFDLDRGD